MSSFSRRQAAVDEGRTEELVFFAFDLLYLEGESLTTLPLVERKEQLQRLLARDVPACVSVSTLSEAALAFAKRPAGWLLKGSFRSVSIAHKPLVTAAFGSNPNA